MKRVVLFLPFILLLGLFVLPQKSQGSEQSTIKVNYMNLSTFIPLKVYFFFRILSLMMFISVAQIADATEPSLTATVVNIAQLDSDYRKEYSHDAPLHLSGITSHEGRLFIIGDKKADRFLYEVEQKNGSWHVIKAIPLDLEGIPTLEGIPSLEGIACKGNYLFTVNEDPTRVYSFTIHNSQLKRNRQFFIDYKSFGVDPERGDDYNAGFEGIACDDKLRTLYLAKERNPRFILSVQLDKSMRDGKVVSQFDVPAANYTFTDDSLGEKKTFSGLTFHEGFLYVLERRAYSIAKIDPKTKELVARLNFSNLKDKKHGSLYHGGTKFGLAEAIVFHDGKILIGLDNNGESVDVNNKWVNKLGLSGREPAIVTLKRPSEF